MVQSRALRNSANVTIAAVAGSLTSFFFSKWINEFSQPIAIMSILIYSLFVFIILYFFFKE